MKQMIKLFLLTISIMLVSCATNNRLSETTVTPLSDNVPVKDGSVVYGLPRTVFTITVNMERTIEVPGPYAKYAGDLLGLTNVIKNESEYWSIENISVRSGEELDPSQFYMVESSSLFRTNVLSLKKEGLILDLNPEIYYSAVNATGIDKSDNSQLHSFDLGSDEYFQLQRDTAYKRVNIDSTFARIPYIVEKKKMLPVDQLAEKAAKRLMEMRDGKHMILTGEANVFPQSEAAINEMNRLEKQYTELFTGKTITEHRTFTCQVIPLKEMAGKKVTLFQFSDLTGPAEGEAKGGNPVIVEFTPEQKTKNIAVSGTTASESKDQKYDKLYYRIPDVVNMKITLGSETLFNSRRLIYQFGQVVQLPSNYIIGK